MEDVLEVYRRPYDPKRPQICIDETSKQLLEHTRIPVPATPGTLLRVDDEYKRCGTANIFLSVEPLTGKTVVKATTVSTIHWRVDASCSPLKRGVGGFRLGPATHFRQNPPGPLFQRGSFRPVTFRLTEH